MASLEKDPKLGSVYLGSRKMTEHDSVENAARIKQTNKPLEWFILISRNANMYFITSYFPCCSYGTLRISLLLGTLKIQHYHCT
jgi:virulence-associated protein VapD